MARIRTIKPDFFTSEDIVALEPRARLLYIALWCEADREGRMAWKPRTWKMRYLPGDDCDINALCDAIVTRGLVCLYGDGLAYIPSFSTHQHVNPRETASALPIPDSENSRVPTRSDASNLDLLVQVGKEGKGREGKGKEGGDSEADASVAVATLVDPAIPEREYFLRGREILGNGAGGIIAELLKAKGRNVALARAALEMASTKQNPKEYVAAICHGGKNGNATSNNRTDTNAGRATAREAQHVTSVGDAALQYLRQSKSAGPDRETSRDFGITSFAHADN